MAMTTLKRVRTLTDVNSTLPVIRHFHVGSGTAGDVDIVSDAPAGSLRIQKHRWAVVQYAEAQSMSTAEESRESNEVEFEGHDARSRCVTRGCITRDRSD